METAKYLCPECGKVVGQIYGDKGREVIKYKCKKCTYGKEKRKKR